MPHASGDAIAVAFVDPATGSDRPIGRVAFGPLYALSILDVEEASAGLLDRAVRDANRQQRISPSDVDLMADPEEPAIARTEPAFAAALEDWLSTYYCLRLSAAA